MLIINAKIYTCVSNIIENGFILTEKDKIVDFGEMKNVPQGDYNIFDARGGFLTPGLIDAHCHIGILEECSERENLNEDEILTPELRAIDGINPFDTAFFEALKAGVTTVVTGQGSASVISGQFAAIKTAGACVDDMIIKSPCSMKISLGENPIKRQNGPKTKMGTAAIIRQALINAKNNENNDDLKTTALKSVLQRKIPVHFHAHRANDIFTAVRISKEFNLDYAIVHCSDGHLVADRIAAENVPVLVGPALDFKSKPELKNLSSKTAGILSKVGMLTAIITDHPVVPINFLTLLAALAVKEGMDYYEAIKAITVNAAKTAGIEDRVGSIEKGMDADIVIFDKEPLDIMAKPLFVMINGERVTL